MPLSIFIDDGASMDEGPLRNLVGEAVMIDLSQRGLREVSRAEPESFAEDLCEGDIVIINTGTHCKYGTKEFITADLYLKLNVARWLADKGICRLGVDTMAIDPLESHESPAHRIILGAGIPIVENLANLDSVDRNRFFFVALPLKIAGAEGAPCRAIAMLEAEPGDPRRKED